MKKECEELARGLLFLDNTLAFGVCDLANKNLSGTRQAMEDGAAQAERLLKVGILEEREAGYFTEASQRLGRALNRDEMEEVKRLLNDAHEYAESLLLEKVIHCECHEGQRGERDGLP